MPSKLAATALALTLPMTALWPFAAARAADVGVSIQISQPGVFGRVDIGRFPQPEVVVAQPVIIGRPVAQVEPVYMWVPPGHRAHWSRYCGQYRACGVPVYFVEDRWYGENVRPHRDERRWEGDEHRGHGRGEGGRRDDRRADGRGEWRDQSHGDGRGEGRGEGHRDRRD